MKTLSDALGDGISIICNIRKQSTCYSNVLDLIHMVPQPNNGMDTDYENNEGRNEEEPISIDISVTDTLTEGPQQKVLFLSNILCGHMN